MHVFHIFAVLVVEQNFPICNEKSCFIQIPSLLISLKTKRQFTLLSFLKKLGSEPTN
jgi:hypothetical protein